jgi:hypothetical protein
MKFIAHRVFKDGETFDGFDARRLDGYHGVELDVREDGLGGVCINHAPVFRRKRGPVDLSGRALCDAVALFAENCPSLELLFLDVKTLAAAEILADKVSKAEIPFRTVFNCWHADEVRAIRQRLPEATVFFCVAPIFSARAPKNRLNDLYVSNSFPFISRSSRFQPQDDKANGHHINVKLISSRTLEASLPEAIDGVCVHRIFRSAALMEFIAARGLKAAFYGLPSRGHARTQALADVADYAIIRKESPLRTGFRRASATHNRDRAA